MKYTAGFELEYPGFLLADHDYDPKYFFRTYEDGTYDNCNEVCSKPFDNVEDFVKAHDSFVRTLFKNKAVFTADFKAPEETGFHISLSGASLSSRDKVKKLADLWHYSLNNEFEKWEIPLLNRMAYEWMDLFVKYTSRFSPHGVRLEYKWGQSTYNIFAGLKYLVTCATITEALENFNRQGYDSHNDIPRHKIVEVENKLCFLVEPVPSIKRFVDKCLEALEDDKSDSKTIVEIGKKLANSYNPLFKSKYYRKHNLTGHFNNPLGNITKILEHDPVFKRRTKGLSTIAVKKFPGKWFTVRIPDSGSNASTNPSNSTRKIAARA